MRDGWPKVRLGEVAEVRLGKMLSRPSRVHADRSPYLRNANVQWDDIQINDLREMHFSEREKRVFSLKAGDVLVCEGGEVGRCAVLDRDLDGVYFQKALHRVRCGPQLEPRFLAHVLRRIATTDGFADLATQSTIQHLTKEKLEQLELRVPPSEEQRRIVDLVASCDHMLDRNQIGQIAVAQMRSALLAELLTPQDGWTRTTVGEIATINPETTSELDPVSDIRYVDLSAVSFGSIDLESVLTFRLNNAPGRAKRVIRNSDVLIATVRPYLRGFAVVPDSLNGEVASTGFAVLRARRDICDPGFLWAIAQTDEFVSGLMARATGSNYPAVRPADVAAHELVLPPLAEQERIVAVLDSVEQQQRALTQQERKTTDLRSALIADLLSGGHEIPESYDAFLAA